MAKKVKRKVSPVSNGTSEINVAPISASDASARLVVNRRTVTAAEFNPDYTYIVKDLKRIGTLAGLFFVVLVALSFIIR